MKAIKDLARTVLHVLMSFMVLLLIQARIEDRLGSCKVVCGDCYVIHLYGGALACYAEMSRNRLHRHLCCLNNYLHEFKQASAGLPVLDMCLVNNCLGRVLKSLQILCSKRVH